MDEQAREKCNANLKPLNTLSPKRAHEIRSAGGRAAAKKRQLKKAFRESMLDSLERMDEQKGKTRQELLIDAIVDKGITGDVRAFDIISGMVEGKDTAGQITVVLEGELEAYSE